VGFFLVSKMFLANYPFTVYGFHFLVKKKYMGVRDVGAGRERENVFCQPSAGNNNNQSPFGSCFVLQIYYQFLN